MPGAGQLIENHTGFQRIDRKQGSQGQRAADKAADLGELEFADLEPAVGDEFQVTGAGGAKFADDQRVAVELAQAVIDHGDATVGEDAGANAQDGGRNNLGEPPAEGHGQGGEYADDDVAHIPGLRGEENLQPVHLEIDPGELWDLAADDDQADPGEVATDHRVRNVANQPSDAGQADQYLDAAGQNAEHGQHQDDAAGGDPLAHHLDGERRENRRGGGARGADQPVRAAERRGNEAESHGAEDPGQGTEGRVMRGDGTIDGDTEGHRGRQGDQHGGKAAPNIARIVFPGSSQFPHDAPVVFIGRSWAPILMSMVIVAFVLPLFLFRVFDEFFGGLVAGVFAWRQDVVADAGDLGVDPAQFGDEIQMR